MKRLLILSVLIVVLSAILSGCGSGGGGQNNNVQPSVITAPNNLVVATTSADAISLAWSDNSNNEDGFKIERSAANASGFTEIGTVGADTSYYYSTGLTAATTYYFRVCGYKGRTNSDYTNTVSVTTQGSAPPAVTVVAPSNLRATATSTTAISLAWSDNSNNEDGFKIERSTASASGFTQIGLTGTNVANYSSTGLSAGTTYYFRVRAYKGTTNLSYSSYSNTANATTQTTTPPPTGNWSGIIACYDQSNSVTGTLYFVTSGGKTKVRDSISPDSQIKWSPNRQYIAARTDNCDLTYLNCPIFFSRSGQTVGIVNNFKDGKQFSWLPDSSGVLTTAQSYLDGGVLRSSGMYKATFSAGKQLTYDAFDIYNSHLVNPVLSCDGQTVYVCSAASGSANIYKISYGALGAGVQYASSVATNICSLTWSSSYYYPAVSLVPLPSGKLIVGVADKILLVNPSNGTTEIQRSASLSSELKLSPDGTKIAYSDYDSIYICYANLALNRQISAKSIGMSGVGEIAFSPDGNSLAIGGPRTSAVGGLYILPIGGSLQTIYEQAGSSGPSHLDWTN